MNPPNFLLLAALLSAEALLVIGCAALTERGTKSGHWRQRIWQACFLCLGLLTLAEWTGARDLLGLRRTSVPTPVLVSSASPKVEIKPLAAIELPEPIATEPLATIAQSDQPPTLSASPSVPAQQPFRPAILIPWLVLIYPIVGALLLLALLTSHLLLFRLLKSCRGVTEGTLLAQVEAMRTALGMSRSVRLLESDRVRGPLAGGLFRPSIILPTGFAQQFESDQQRVMLVHELAHLANRDPAWHLLTDLISICFWFHPAIWWARGRMQTAGEAAADEASVLIRNGPETLAECLVTLGTRLMQEPVAGGFGIAGWRFKSNLGRRVARLLHFKERAWSPPGRARSFCLRALAPAILVLVMLWSSAWAAPRLPQATKIRSPRPSAFVGDLANEPGMGISQVEPDEFARLEGDQAEKSAAQRDDPKGSSPAVPAQPQPNGRKSAIRAKLREIILPEVPFSTSSLEEAVKILGSEAKKHDPAGEGVNFIIPDSTDGNGLPLPLPCRVNVAEPPVPLRTPPEQISLGEALDILVAAADPSFTYTVSDEGVRLNLSLMPPGPRLYTKFYRVDLAALMSVIKEMGVSTADDQLPAGVDEPEDVVRSLDGKIVDKLSSPPALLRKFFNEAGVDLSAPKSLLYAGRLGQLLIRATRPDLELIEQTLQTLSASPPQVTIEVKWCERRVDQPWPEGLTVQNADGTDLTLKGILTPAQSRTFIDALQKQAGVDLLTAPKVTTLSGRQAQIKVVEVRHIVTDLYVSTNEVRTADGKMHSGALLPISEPYELGPVLDIVPTVRADNLSIDLTVTGTLKEFIGYDTVSARERKLDLGPSVPAKPVLAQVGYDVEGAKKNNPEAPVRRQPLNTTTPLPMFRVRQIASAASVYDGQTLVLAGGMASFETKMKDKVPFLGDIPLAGRLFRSEHKETVKKELLLLITARLIDPAGNAIHSDEELTHKTDGRVPDAASPAK